MTKDRLSQKERSQHMAKIGSKDTSPELTVRRLTYSMGYRYRLHRKDLPGKPDMVFPGRQKVIFVHGCFWHGHQCPAGRNQPKSRQEYWGPKIKQNKKRDKENISRLKKSGWDVLVLWECELKDIDEISRRIKNFLN